MPLAVNDVIQTSVRSTLFDQRIINVFTWRLTSSSSVISVEGDLQNIANKLAGDFLVGGTLMEQLLECIAPQLTVIEVRAQRVSPLRSIYSAASVVQPGTNPDPCTTPNIAACVTKRSSVPGRKGLGKVMIAGVPASAILAGGLSPLYVASLNSFALKLPQNLLVTGGSLVLQPGMFNPGVVPGFSPIFEGIVQDRASTMHRRTLRVGE